jgi:uncharacterized membrane protein
VTIRLLETITAVARHAREPVFRESLRRHADAILRGSHDGLSDAFDRADVEQRHRLAIEQIDRPPAEHPSTGDCP